MSDLGECCYGMGFGPEGDGVALVEAPPMYERGDVVGVDYANGIVTYRGRPSVRTVELWNAAMNSVTPKRQLGSFENIKWPQWLFDDKPESNAKPSLPALTRQAGEKYKGLGFCDGMDQ